MCPWLYNFTDQPSETLIYTPWFRLAWLVVLLHRAPITRGYSRGAPRSLCHVSGEGHVSRVTNVSLVPRHGYLPQPPASSPAWLELDQASVAPSDYVRVTLRSSQAYKVLTTLIIRSSCFALGSRFNKDSCFFKTCTFDNILCWYLRTWQSYSQWV